MDAQTYNDTVEAAIWAGGVAGGQWLDSKELAEVPFARLTKEEYFEYLCTVYQATEADLKQRIEDWAAVTGAGENG